MYILFHALIQHIQSFVVIVTINKGFGMSGFGAYHGKTGFDEYSHLRSILYRSNEHGKIYIPLASQAASNVVPTGVRDGMFEKLTGQQ